MEPTVCTNDAKALQSPQWQSLMGLLRWGYFLTYFTLNIANLNYILSAIGAALLLTGFYRLRRENKYFRLAWRVNLVCAALKFVQYVLDATLIAELTGFSDHPAWITLLFALPLLREYQLWRGLVAVQEETGLESPSAAPVIGLMVWFIALYGAALTGLGGWIVVLPLLFLFLFILSKLGGLADRMDEENCPLPEHPDHHVGPQLSMGYLGAMLACILIALFLGTRYPMNWAPLPAQEQAGLEDLRAHLLELNFPQDVLDDLSAEDLAALEGAVFVESDYHWETVEGKPTLKFTTVAVESHPPGESFPVWEIIHHFYWWESPEYRGTECIKLSPIWETGSGSGYFPYESSSNAKMDGDPTGRLLYTDGNTIYTVPYHSLGMEHYTCNSIFFGSSYNQDIFATFSLPKQGEEFRGYISYSARDNSSDVFLLNAWIDYTRQTTRFTYPMVSAKAYELSGAWDHRYSYDFFQTALQFYPHWPEDKTHS